MRNDLLTKDIYLGAGNPAFDNRRTSFSTYKSGSLYRTQTQHDSRRTTSPIGSTPASNGSFGIRVARPVSRKVRTRRRIAIALLVTISILAVLLPAREAFGGRSLVTSERRAAASSENTISIVVQPGDTLWSIAKRLEPNKDPRKVVHELSKARDGKPLMAGETIKWVK